VHYSPRIRLATTTITTRTVNATNRICVLVYLPVRQMVKRREISEKIIQEQMKRKRQTKKIEERLAKLIPLINEANSMAEELRKPVRFEARLSVKSNNVNLSTIDELRNLKTIDVTIRVTSLENGNVWNWSADISTRARHTRLIDRAMRTHEDERAHSSRQFARPVVPDRRSDSGITSSSIRVCS
jgi:hypothetical protein